MAKLHAPGAIAILRAESRYLVAKRQADALKRERDEVRQRYARLLPLGEAVEVAGYIFKRAMKSTGERFRLGEYRKAHEISEQMLPFVTPAADYEDWQVKPARDAVPVAAFGRAGDGSV